MTTTRRQFLRASGIGAAATVLAPQSLVLPAHGQGIRLLRSGRFSDGIVSADPTQSSIALWTRLADAEGSGKVLLEVATDDDFRKVITRERITTSGAVNHAVKAQVTGLKAHTQYFYRFATDHAESRVGRFRTAAPPDSNEPVKFAYWSCQDFSHGWYNAHELMAKEDLDFMVCLGDYIYAETYHTKKDGTAVREDRIGRDSRDPKTHARDAVTLNDYREKYSLYRSDPALRRIHELFPMVYVPDDHEVQDNWAGKPKNGGLGPEKLFSQKRKAAARKAFFESNPRFPGGTKLYRSLKFGNTVELFLMDQRSYRDNQPCGDGIVPPCDELPQPRDFLGRTQMNWLKDGLSKSTASWKILGNEVMIMETKALGNSYLNYDSWQGYPGERAELINHIATQGIKDVVFVTGDIHTFIAGDVKATPDSPTVALEFVGGSITSQGLGEITFDVGGGVKLKGNDKNPRTDPSLINALRGINTWVDQADFDHHGYGLISVTEQGLTSRFKRVQTIKKKSLKTMPEKGFTYNVQRGQTSIKGVNGPAPA